MKLFHIIIGSLFFSILLLSCKNDPKNSDFSPGSTTSDISEEADNTELTKTRKKTDQQRNGQNDGHSRIE